MAKTGLNSREVVDDDCLHETSRFGSREIGFPVRPPPPEGIPSPVSVSLGLKGCRGLESSFHPMAVLYEVILRRNRRQPLTSFI